MANVTWVVCSPHLVKIDSFNCFSHEVYGAFRIGRMLDLSIDELVKGLCIEL